jgi:hypothetical protein
MKIGANITNYANRTQVQKNQQQKMQNSQSQQNIGFSGGVTLSKGAYTAMFLGCLGGIVSGSRLIYDRVSPLISDVKDNSSIIADSEQALNCMRNNMSKTPSEYRFNTIAKACARQAEKIR